MRKYSLLLALLLPALTLFSQDKLKPTGESANGITGSISPVITISAEEIKRFPSPNFLDAVEGLFPWVYAQGQKPGNFLFIVNGMLIADVNSINLNDIEEISFTRDNMYGGLLTFARAGTFFITTKKATGKLSIQFNSQANVINNNRQPYFGKESYIYSPYTSVYKNDIANNNGNYISNHLSLSRSGKKYDWYAAAYFNHNTIPGLEQNVLWGQTGDTAKREEQVTVKSRLQQYSLFTMFNYAFSSKLKAGIMANYAKRNFKGDSIEIAIQNTGYYNQEINNSTNFKTLTIAAYLHWQPLSRLSNRLSAEYIRFKNEVQEPGTREFTFMNTIRTIASLKKERTTNSGILIRNELKYALVQNSRITVDIDVNALWYKPSFKSNSGYVEIDSDHPTLPSISTAWSEYSQRSGLINPAFHFSYNNIVSAYAGAGYLFGVIKNGKIKAGDRINPYGGIDINLKNILKAGKAVDALHLSFNYAQLAKSNYSLPQLDDGRASGGIGAFSAYYIANPDGWDIIRDKMIAVKLTAGFLQERLLFTAEWSKLTYDKFFFSQVFGNPPYMITMVEDEIAEGFSFQISGNIIHKKDWELSSRFNVMFPKVHSDIAPYISNYVNETAARAGLQNKLAYKNSFVQLNALLYMDQQYSSPNSTVTTKKNDLIINNIIAGYSFSNAKGIFKNSVVFAQARNIYVSQPLKEKYLYNKFIGVGINLSIL